MVIEEENSILIDVDYTVEYSNGKGYGYGESFGKGNDIGNGSGYGSGNGPCNYEGTGYGFGKEDVEQDDFERWL